MLIDFSDQLQVNLYVLGAVWLQLCRLFSMESTLMFTKWVQALCHMNMQLLSLNSLVIVHMSLLHVTAVKLSKCWLAQVSQAALARQIAGSTIWMHAHSWHASNLHGSIIC